MVLYLTEGLINESVSGGDVSRAIRNREAILITYDDETRTSHQGVRYIEPYVFGTTIKGNPCIRAYQYFGDTKRGVPKWKLFRLDRITSWEPTGEKFELEPKARGWAAEAYNNNGDNSMSNVYLTVDLGEDKPLTDYERLKAKTRQLQNGKRLNIAQLQPNRNTKSQSYIQKQPQKLNGPVNSKGETENQVQVRQDSPVDMETKVETIPQDMQPQMDVNKEKQTQRQEGPINDKPQTDNTESNVQPMSDDAFRQMIQRNLDITRQEKERRKQRNFGNKA